MDLSGSEAWAGSVNTALTLGTALTAIPFSQLALARGRRLALTTGLILLGLGWSATTVAGSTLLVSALDPEQRVPVQGFSDAALSPAGALGSAAAGPVMGLIGYPGISGLAALVIAAPAVVILRLPARHP